MPFLRKLQRCFGAAVGASGVSAGGSLRDDGLEGFSLCGGRGVLV